MLSASSGTQTSRQELEEVQTFIGSNAWNAKGERGREKAGRACRLNAGGERGREGE